MKLQNCKFIITSYPLFKLTLISTGQPCIQYRSLEEYNSTNFIDSHVTMALIEFTMLLAYQYATSTTCKEFKFNKN